VQNLRDKLLKAGLVDRKKKKKIEHQQRLARQGRKPDDAEAERQRQERYLRQLEEKKRRDRARQQAEQARRRQEAELAARQQQEQRQRQRQEAERERRRRQARRILAGNMFLPARPGPVAFHFVSRSGGIRRLMLSTGLVHDLSRGLLAICQLPARDRERIGLVRRDVARQLLELDAGLVRFFVTEDEEPLVGLPPVEAAAPPSGSPRTLFHLSARAGAGERRER